MAWAYPPNLSKKDLPCPGQSIFMRYPIILALALLFFGPCALCQTADHSLDDAISSVLKDLVVESSEELESYTFILEMRQDMKLENLSSGQSQQILTRSIGFGLVNMTDQALKLVMASLTYIPGEESNSSAMALEEYLQNDTLYMKIDGNWTAMQLSGIGGAWSKQNSLEQQIDMFNQSSLTLIGSDMVGEEDCYKVRAEFDIASHADQLSQEMASYVPLLPLNSSELFRNMTQEVHYWIAKKSHMLKRTDVFVTLYMTPQSLGLNTTQGENIAARINTTTSMTFDGFNESVNIVLPPEASGALLFQMPSYPESEAVPVSGGDDGRAIGNEFKLPPLAVEDAAPSEDGAKDEGMGLPLPDPRPL